MARKRTTLPKDEPKLSSFMLADHAEAVNGKLYLTGGCWNILFAKELPLVHPHLSVAAAIEVPWTMTNELHTLHVQMLDADRNPLLPQRLEGQFEVGRPPGMRPGDHALVVLVFNINNLKFEKTGSYSFALTMNDSELGATHFKVQRVEQS